MERTVYNGTAHEHTGRDAHAAVQGAFFAWCEHTMSYQSHTGKQMSQVGVGLLRHARGLCAGWRVRRRGPIVADGVVGSGAAHDVLGSRNVKCFFVLSWCRFMFSMFLRRQQSEGLESFLLAYRWSRILRQLCRNVSASWGGRRSSQDFECNDCSIKASSLSVRPTCQLNPRTPRSHFPPLP